jgi:hypothetical protein
METTACDELDHVQQGEQDQRPDDGREDRPEATEAV